MPEINIPDQDNAMQMCDPSQQNMAKEQKEGEEIIWNTKNDVRLLKSLIGLKPVGVNRYFTMMGIHQKFSILLQKELYSKAIWDHLDSFYDMSSLHESEILPFPNEEIDFELSEEEFNDLVEEKFGVTLTPLSVENETKNYIKSGKKPILSKGKQTTSSVTNAKSPFVTPNSIKPTKNFGGKVEPITDVKPSVEISIFAKSYKVKRASSPFQTARKSKPDSASVKEESDNSTSKKNVKVENTTPASAKKTPKSEPVSSNNSSTKKSSTRQETNTSSSKSKIETPDSSSKKGKEMPVKKGRPSLTPNSSKNSKGDNKKETDSSKRTSEVSNIKGKSDRLSNASSKGKGDDSESASGSKKHSTGKTDANDKKRKNQKVEDSSKKVTSQAKRRRMH